MIRNLERTGTQLTYCQLAMPLRQAHGISVRRLLSHILCMVLQFWHHVIGLYFTSCVDATPTWCYQEWSNMNPLQCGCEFTCYSEANCSIQDIAEIKASSFFKEHILWPFTFFKCFTWPDLTNQFLPLPSNQFKRQNFINQWITV